LVNNDGVVVGSIVVSSNTFFPKGTKLYIKPLKKKTSFKERRSL
jgi:hypothetical protein